MAYQMTHPDGGELEARAEDVAMYESQGWETSRNAKSPTEDDDKKK
jgi:hypothetical protein